jgi:sugar phosphate isomerase/epimerase
VVGCAATAGMRLAALDGAHLTYCTNVHPGESLSEVRAVLTTQVARVKAALCPSQAFGLGLRLAAAACETLAAGDALGELRRALDAAGLYVFTLNGFPYGAFHGTRVKEGVYRPDWREAERLRYTAALARVLASLLPDGVRGSISTVPGAFRPRVPDRAAAREMAHQLARAVAELVAIERETGRRIALAIEPEPCCAIETSAEAIAFFAEEIWAPDTRQLLAGLIGVGPSAAETLLRQHLGVCLDTCHAVVEFESPLDAFRRLRAAGILVPKIQISAGIRLPTATPERRAALAAFANDVYLHQVVMRDGDALERLVDLPDALATPVRSDSEWRVHFHVPIFHHELGPFESTQSELLPLLQALRAESDIPHLEVETYTWDVLPAELRNVPVTEAVVRELQWVLAQFEPQSP